MWRNKIKTGNLARHKKTIHSQGIKSRVEEEFKCDQCPYVTKNNFMDTRSMLKDLLCIRENNIKVLSTSIVLILEISSKINIFMTLCKSRGPTPPQHGVPSPPDVCPHISQTPAYNL